MNSLSKGMVVWFLQTKSNVVDTKEHNIKNRLMGGSPGLVVMGGDSRPRVCGFESGQQILDGHFSNILLKKL